MRICCLEIFDWSSDQALYGTIGVTIEMLIAQDVNASQGLGKLKSQ
jgi:hypothetical protein